MDYGDDPEVKVDLDTGFKDIIIPQSNISKVIVRNEGGDE